MQLVITELCEKQPQHLLEHAWHFISKVSMKTPTQTIFSRVQLAEVTFLSKNMRATAHLTSRYFIFFRLHRSFISLFFF